LDAEYLEIAVKIVSDVLKESIKVFFNDLELSSNQVSPLNHHVVKRYECIVEGLQSLGLGDPIQNFS
jgi:hypothetical protein